MIWYSTKNGFEFPNKGKGETAWMQDGNYVTDIINRTNSKGYNKVNQFYGCSFC